MKCCRAGLCLIALAASLAASPARAASEDPRDLLVIMPALNDVLENERSGKDVSWTNVVTGRAGSIRVERTYYRGQQPCRDYTRTTTGNGPGYEVQGTGCRVGKQNWSVEETRKDEPLPTATAAAPAIAPPPSSPATDPAAVPAPSGDPSATRAPRKPAAPPPPTLSYGLPTRSQL